MTRIACLHTADIHVAAFDALLDEAGHRGGRAHCVMPDLLAAARRDGLEAVRAQTLAVLARLTEEAEAVLCTCSTLGPIADAAGPRVLRIDRPAMAAACGCGPAPMVALCLESTRAATLDLLHDCARAAGLSVSPRVVLCAEAWPFFERGDMPGFAAAIEAAVRAEIARAGTPDCVLLAQASMQAAQSRLADIGAPVITTPRLAAAQALRVARGIS